MKTRKEAKAEGSRFYEARKPCPICGGTKRYTSTAACTRCVSDQTRARWASCASVRLRVHLVNLDRVVTLANALRLLRGLPALPAPKVTARSGDTGNVVLRVDQRDAETFQRETWALWNATVAEGAEARAAKVEANIANMRTLGKIT